MQRFGHKLSGSSKTQKIHKKYGISSFLKVKLRLFRPNFRAFEISHYALVYIVVIPQNKNENF